MPLAAPTIAESLRAGGYTTIGIGKWHNSPNSATPNESWPSQRGFDQFYGFMEGETSYFFPARIVNNNTLAPIDQYPPDYYATDDWTNHGMQFVREARNNHADKPFFLYLAYNAVHGPLQAKEPDSKEPDAKESVSKQPDANEPQSKEFDVKAPRDVRP
jgi:arylsulfatase